MFRVRTHLVCYNLFQIGCQDDLFSSHGVSLLALLSNIFKLRVIGLVFLLCTGGVCCTVDFVLMFTLLYCPNLFVFLSLSRNKQGQTRLSSYYEWLPLEERAALESEIIRKCLSRSEFQCSFLEYRGYKVIYRRYASLFFILGTRPDIGQTENNENELGLLEFIHTLVETSKFSSKVIV